MRGPLVPIQMKGSKSPFFCVHGAGGNVLNLRDLSRRLGDQQPFYGLQAQGVDGKLPLRRIEDMATIYLEAVRDVQPHGPYLLGGFSGGGVVAFEMAQRLQADGEEVKVLAFFETFCPVQPKRPKQTLPKGLLAAPSWWPGFEFALKRAKICWHTRHGRPVPYHLREFALYDSFLGAQQKYKPKPYSGSVSVWRADERDPAFAWIGSDLGWEPYVAGGLDIHHIPGTHHTLVLEPSVQILVFELQAVLDNTGTGTLQTAA
jgi:thioesterase domain-containing protein